MWEREEKKDDSIMEGTKREECRSFKYKIRLREYLEVLTDKSKNSIVGNLDYTLREKLWDIAKYMIITTKYNNSNFTILKKKIIPVIFFLWQDDRNFCFDFLAVN